MDLEPLGTEDARELLAKRSEPVAVGDEARLLAAAAGNPLVLLELPVELAREPTGSVTAGERLRQTFSPRVEELPRQARSGLLLASAEADVHTVRRAAALLGVREPLAAAEAAGLVQIAAGHVVFRHPVVRSLVYAEAPAAERQAAHRALAEVLVTEADRDRRAWHMAAAADGVDEGVATALEETAGRAAARGGLAAHGRALERAARLSPGPTDRARRMFAAAGAFRRAGDSGHALELAAEALPLASDRLLHADLVHLMGSIRLQQDAGISELEFLRELEVEGLDAERKAKLLTLVMEARLYAFDAVGAVALALDAEAAARGAEWPFGLTYIASAYLLAGERERATALCRELAASPDLLALSPWDYLWLEWYAELGASLAEALRNARAGGNQVRVAYTLAASVHLELRIGRLSRAAAAAAEAIPLAEAIGTSAIAGIASGGLALVHAWRGQADACKLLAGAALTVSRGAGDTYQEGVAHQALALLALGSGRLEDVIVELEPIARRWAASTVVEPGVVPFVPDLIEAYALAGSPDDARTWLRRFAAAADAADRTWALAVCARCDGLLAADDAFDEPFRRALALHDGSSLGLERARTQLAYGERLRRAGRRREARTFLRLAHDAFVHVGAAGWGARAATELRATGEQVADETQPLPELTPQELHIGLLVAEGKTNKEIAAAMFLSPKTIEYHLANTFRKLDIHSRAELARIVS